MTTHVTNIAAPDITRRKAALESRLNELLRVSHEREDLQIEFLADPLDQMKSNADREMAVNRLNRQTRLIRDLQSALAKIEAGTYGICEECEDPIHRARLDAVPWAGLCVRCQSQAEAAIRFQDAA